MVDRSNQLVNWGKDGGGRGRSGDWMVSRFVDKSMGQLRKTERRARWNRAFREREIEGLSGLPDSNRPKQRLLATRSSMRDVGRLLFLSRTQALWCILRA